MNVARISWLGYTPFFPALPSPFSPLIHLFVSCYNLQLSNMPTQNAISVVTVITANIATAVDSFHRITTATTVAIDVFNGRCSEGAF